MMERFMYIFTAAELVQEHIVSCNQVLSYIYMFSLLLQRHRIRIFSISSNKTTVSYFQYFYSTSRFASCHISTDIP